MIELFEKKRELNNSSESEVLWNKVNLNKAVLYRETLRKVHEYEETLKK